MENNFHHRRHRKVAMRQTLPNSQMSLSLRKFSMMTTLLFLSPVYFLFQPLCFLWQRSFRWRAAMLTWHRTASIDYEILVGRLLWLCIECLVPCSLQSQARKGVCAVKSPAHPANHSPSTRLLPCLPPQDLKGEDMLTVRREGDRWCWVQGVVAVRRIRCLLLLLLVC